jgi:hypothetical protein
MLNQADEPAATCRVHARYWQSSSRQIRSRRLRSTVNFWRRNPDADLGSDCRKRTALYELEETFAEAPIATHRGILANLSRFVPLGTLDSLE